MLDNGGTLAILTESETPWDDRASVRLHGRAGVQMTEVLAALDARRRGMRIDLTGRTALVTGSTSGIGAAIAAGLRDAGATVAVNGRDPDRTAAAAARLGARAVPGDVGTAEGCAAVLAAVPDVDVLVNNAGIFVPTPVFEIPDEDWTRTSRST